MYGYWYYRVDYISQFFSAGRRNARQLARLTEKWFLLCVGRHGEYTEYLQEWREFQQAKADRERINAIMRQHKEG